MLVADQQFSQVPAHVSEITSDNHNTSSRIRDVIYEITLKRLNLAGNCLVVTPITDLLEYFLFHNDLRLNADSNAIMRTVVNYICQRLIYIEWQFLLIIILYGRLFYSQFDAVML